MRLALPTLILALPIAAQEKQQTDPEIERLLRIADDMKAALSMGNLEPALKLVAEASAGISQRDNTQKFVQLEASLPSDDSPRLTALAPVARAAYEALDDAKAETYARELLTLAEKYPKHEDYGYALYVGNMVLGRVALRRDKNVEEAKACLFRSGHTPGSAMLNSCGPNMSLAKDLLEAGEGEAVVKFFGQCRRFWQLHGKKLDQWTAIVEKGCCRIPNFGGNLIY